MVGGVLAGRTTVVVGRSRDRVPKVQTAPEVKAAAHADISELLCAAGTVVAGGVGVIG